MSPDSPRDWSGLLYLPGEDLVRSTIDGDDADWSESLSYVPSDALVRTVLDASLHERPAIRLPATLVPHPAPHDARSRARRAAAVLTGLGLSPFSLAAAAVIHLGVWLAVGPWVVTQAHAARSIHLPRPPAIVATRLVYVPPTLAGATEPRVVTVRAVDTTNQGRRVDGRTGGRGGLDTVTTSRRDSAFSSPVHPAPPSNVAREVRSALRQELFFVQDGFELRIEDRPKLEFMVRLLTTWPALRLRVLGAGPPRAEPGPPPGMAEAEAIKRVLVQAGIAAERIEVGQIPEADRRCSDREPNCGRSRRRVQTMEIDPANDK
jgi:hypothetical protein